MRHASLQTAVPKRRVDPKPVVILLRARELDVDDPSIANLVNLITAIARSLALFAKKIEYFALEQFYILLLFFFLRGFEIQLRVATHEVWPNLDCQIRHIVSSADDRLFVPLRLGSKVGI